MKIHDHSFRRWAVAAFISLMATAGTVAAQGSDPNAGAYGGTTYGGAQAAPAPAPPPPAPEPVAAQPTTEYYEPATVSRPWYSVWGVALALGGGVEGFASEGDTNTSTGGNWNLRASVGTRQVFAVEGSYIGSAQSINALGLDSSAVLVGNGLQGAIRLNMITGIHLDPFVFGGLAWRHYDLTNNDFNQSDVAGSDDVMEVPLGGGIQYAYGGVLLDARAEYRLASYGDMFNRTNIDANMDRWGVQGNVGVEF